MKAIICLAVTLTSIHGFAADFTVTASKPMLVQTVELALTESNCISPTPKTFSSSCDVLLPRVQSGGSWSSVEILNDTSEIFLVTLQEDQLNRKFIRVSTKSNDGVARNAIGYINKNRPRLQLTYVGPNLQE